jgi:hypothetical protein
MVDAPREVVGAAAKVVGLSYNTPDLDVSGSMPRVAQALQQLSTQVKFLIHTHYRVRCSAVGSPSGPCEAQLWWKQSTPVGRGVRCL